MKRKVKKIYNSKLNWLLVLASTITGCTSVSAFTSLISILIVITSLAIGLNICTITAGFRKYNSTNKKKKKNSIRA